eukprot:tig00000430_g611.t1
MTSKNCALPGYKGESFYKKLFETRDKERPQIGYNDSRWREDAAGAVARTVAFVAEETGALEVLEFENSSSLNVSIGIVF